MCGKSAWGKKKCIARAEQYRKGRAWRRESVTITSTRIMAAFCHCAAILSRLLLRLLLAANAARLIAATVEAKIHVPPTSVPSIYLSLSSSALLSRAETEIALIKCALHCSAASASTSTSGWRALTDSPPPAIAFSSLKSSSCFLLPLYTPPPPPHTSLMYRYNGLRLIGFIQLQVKWTGRPTWPADDKIVQANELFLIIDRNPASLSPPPSVATEVQRLVQIPPVPRPVIHLTQSLNQFVTVLWLSCCCYCWFVRSLLWQIAWN